MKHILCFFGFHGPPESVMMLGINQSTGKEEQIPMDRCSWCKFVFFPFPF